MDANSIILITHYSRSLSHTQMGVREREIDRERERERVCVNKNDRTIYIYIYIYIYIKATLSYQTSDNFMHRKILTNATTILYINGNLADQWQLITSNERQKLQRKIHSINKRILPSYTQSHADPYVHSHTLHANKYIYIYIYIYTWTRTSVTATLTKIDNTRIYWIFTSTHTYTRIHKQKRIRIYIYTHKYINNNKHMNIYILDIRWHKTEKERRENKYHKEK